MLTIEQRIRAQRELAARSKPTASKLTAEGLKKSQALLRQSIDGMARAVAEFEKLGRLARDLAQDAAADARA